MDTLNRFQSFTDALQARLNTTVQVKALSAHAYELRSSGVPFDIHYYQLPTINRIVSSSAKRCIHIDEDIWQNRPILLLARLAALAGQATRIHARNTVIARIDKQTAHAFQQEHHLQVALPGKYRYGAFHQGDLVAITVFSGGRKMNSKPESYRSFELLRFCHKQGCAVIGGFSKLLDAFRRDFNPGDIMTYADKDWSDGESYQKTGFSIVGETDPQLFWIKADTQERFTEFSLPENVSGKSADERKKAGFFPVYNSGSLKLVKVML